MPLTALILAGGKGTRLAGLYPDLPKPLVPVAGEPFLHWLVLWLKRQGLRDFVFSLGYRGEQIAAWLKTAPIVADINWHIFQESEALGTGGGVRASLHLCANDPLITNGDSLLLAPLAPAMKHFEQPACDGVLIGLPIDDASPYGSLITDDTGHLIAFREKQPGRGIINGGIYLLRKQLLENFPTGQNLSMEYDVIPKLVSRNCQLFVHQTGGDVPFIDIGTPQTARLLPAFIKRYITS